MNKFSLPLFNVCNPFCNSSVVINSNKTNVNADEIKRVLDLMK